MCLFSNVIAVTVLVAFAAFPPAVRAETNELLCKARVEAALLREHDIYRSHLFGSRLDNDGKIMSKTGGEVDKVRKGIFETRRRLTSEFINPAVEAYRAYRCRNLMICRNMALSFNDPGDAPGDLTRMVRILGCEPQRMTAYEECRFGVAGSQEDVTRMTDYCLQTVNDTLAFERDALKLAAAYDAGYRALLQFSGMVDWMMKDMPTRNFMPLRGMVNMLGKLYQIPCFTSQCDLPDNKDLDIPGIPSM